MKRFIPFWLFGLVLLPGAARAGGGIDTQVSTGIFYYPADAEKRVRAATERAEDGLEFHAAVDPKDLARETADEEMRHGNVCLRQLRAGLKSSVKKWRVRELCERIFQGHLESALRDAAREKLHPDHVECSAEIEAKETKGAIGIVLAFRGQLVMRDRAPAKLRRAGIGGDFTRWDLPEQTDTLGEAAGSWKEALKSGACSADARALEGFWDRQQKKAAEARELAECRNGRAREDAEIGRIQVQLRDYVPEEWVKETAGKEYEALMEAPASSAGGLKECRVARESADRQLERLRSVASKIADKYDVSALSAEHAPGRAPASENEDEGD